MPIDQPQAGDSVGPYSIEQLIAMDATFVARVEAAFASGRESPQAAGMTVQAAPRGAREAGVK
jgi:hypothetical protein